MLHRIFSEGPATMLYRSPEGDPPTGGGDAPKDAPEPGLPTDPDDLAVTARRVHDRWILHPDITMVGTSITAFEADVIALEDAADARRLASGARPGHTQTLEALDKAAEQAVSKVKIYLLAKYEDEAVAKAAYGNFGIVKEGNNYRLPSDRQDRLGALDLMVAAIAGQGFGDKEYGTAFWTAHRTAFAAALDAAQDTDSNVSGAGGELEPAAARVHFVLTGLRFILRGNYQDTYQQVLREWGMQAEDN